MSRRAVGCAFVAIGAFLYAARYITAAIYINHVQEWGREWFQRAMSYVGPDLHIWAFAAFLVGVIYLVWGEWSDRRLHKQGT